MQSRTSELGERLRAVLGDFVRVTRRQAGTPSTAQAEALGILDREGAMSVANLAQRRSVKHQSMRLVVGQLEAEGLVHRTSDPADGRSQSVALTSTGREHLTESRVARAEWIGAALGQALSEDELDLLEDAVDLLRRVIVSREA